MTISEGASLLGSVFTGLSVLVAVMIFRRTEDRELFARFRLVLVDFRHHVRHIDRLLAEPYFTEVSTAIACHIRDLLPDNFTTDTLIKYLADKENHNYVATAIHLGIQESPSNKEARELANLIERMPYEFREQLPIVSGIIGRVSHYITVAARAAVSPWVFNQTIGTPQVFTKVLAPVLEKHQDRKTLINELTIIIEETSKSAMLHQGQPAIDQATVILAVIIEKYANMNDRALSGRADTNGRCWDP